MSKAQTDLKKFFKKIETTIGEAISTANAVKTAKFTIDLIVKRTRLGYGVSETLADKSRLKSLSAKYVKRRRTFENLSESTTAQKSNLTLTGQMLESVKILEKNISKTSTSIVIGPSGNRWDSDKTNAEIAEFNANTGRVFMNVSRLEYNQILRFYRKSFADLFRKRNLLR